MWLAGCGGLVGPRSEPLNQPIVGSAETAFAATRTDPTAADDVVLGLAFSGGGTRAAAFSFGVLQEVEGTYVTSRTGSHSLLDRVAFVSGVSGGSVLTAYYGLKKRAALDDFRERFLIRNAEEGLSTSITPVNLVRALGGGVNDSGVFSKWLSRNLFDGATFADFRKTPGPQVWINASDIYNRTAFVFGESAFIALCSDLASYPIADAVAASAAVPIVFTPVVIKTYPQQCADRTPPWAARARSNPNAHPMLRHFADALYGYRTGSTKFVKLLDGGLVDNFGLSGFTISRLSASTPFEPLAPDQAVRLRRLMIVIVDSGRAPSGDWVQTVEGPTGTELIMAAADTAVAASVNAGFTAFERSMVDWQRQLVAWRCGLSPEQRAKYRRLGELELPRSEILRQSHRLRSARPGARKALERCRYAVHAADRPSRHGDRGWPRRLARQSGVPRFLERRGRPSAPDPAAAAGAKTRRRSRICRVARRPHSPRSADPDQPGSRPCFL